MPAVLGNEMTWKFWAGNFSDYHIRGTKLAQFSPQFSPASPQFGYSIQVPVVNRFNIINFGSNR